MSLKYCQCLESVNTILVNKSSQNIYVYKEHIASVTLAMLDTPNIFSDWLPIFFSFIFPYFSHEI